MMQGCPDPVEIPRLHPPSLIAAPTVHVRPTVQSTYNFDEGFCRDEVARGLPSPASLLINFDLLLVQHDSCSAGTHAFSSPSWRYSSQPSGDDQLISLEQRLSRQHHFGRGVM